MPVISSFARNTLPSESSYTFHFSTPTRSNSTCVVLTLLGSSVVGGGFVGVLLNVFGAMVVKRFWDDQAYTGCPVGSQSVPRKILVMMSRPKSEVPSSSL